MNFQELYAKTYYENDIKKGETIKDHTEKLLSELEEFKRLYSKEINERIENPDFWKDLKLVCLLHDLGKVSIQFQNKIRTSLNLPKLTNNFKEIPHNYISPAFLSGFNELGKKENINRLYRILFSIAFHHERDLDFNKEFLKEHLSGQITPLKNEIIKWIKNYFSEYNDFKPVVFYYELLQNYLDGNNTIINEIKKDKTFIFLKGLLHRLDYAASAHVPVETEKLGEPLILLETYIKKNYNSDLKPFQKNAIKHRDKNIVLSASTGCGKTEFAINWLGNSKGFYTLPLRVSSNAIYERLKKIFNKNKIGLLHSDSFTYLLENNNDELSIEENINKMTATRQLSYPLTVTTADQLFTSVFKWPGYERIYATLAYSKIILDEPQGYSPKTLAMIIKCLEEINTLGGKFCYMSATNHPFILNKLKSFVEILLPVFRDEKKHKIELVDVSIDSFDEKIFKEFKNGKKVLVIVNTVKKSQELYEKFNRKITNLKLLHSGFIKSDRDQKEFEIQSDFKKNNGVVWISTQIVEASLDIDYDVLFTEIASLDSLVQRMGRIFRRSGRIINSNDKPNIYVATANPSDNYYIYNKTITERTLDALKQFQNKVLTDEYKQELMNIVYNEDEIKNTQYYKEFKSAYELLEYGFQANNKGEAQKLFRDICNVCGIPIPVYEHNDRIIDNLILKIKNKNISLEERILANQSLNKFTLSVPYWKGMSSAKLLGSKDISKSIYLIPCIYNDKTGIKLDKVENIF